MWAADCVLRTILRKLRNSIPGRRHRFIRKFPSTQCSQIVQTLKVSPKYAPGGDENLRWHGGHHVAQFCWICAKQQCWPLWLHHSHQKWLCQVREWGINCVRLYLTRKSEGKQAKPRFPPVFFCLGCYGKVPPKLRMSFHFKSSDQEIHTRVTKLGLLGDSKYSQLLQKWLMVTQVVVSFEHIFLILWA